MDYQRFWADNNVSITVTFKKEEVGEIVKVLEAYEDQLKSISFLPISEHGYEQAPYQEISESEYNKICSNITEVDYSVALTTPVGESYCSNDSCDLPKKE